MLSPQDSCFSLPPVDDIADDYRDVLRSFLDFPYDYRSQVVFLAKLVMQKNADITSYREEIDSLRERLDLPKADACTETDDLDLITSASPSPVPNPVDSSLHLDNLFDPAFNHAPSIADSSVDKSDAKECFPSVVRSDPILPCQKLKKKSIPTRKYRPKPAFDPIQCYNCQQLGHKAFKCRNNPRCVKCGGDHSSRCCLKPYDIPPTCANCSQQHTANYRRCSAFTSYHAENSHSSAQNTKSAGTFSSDKLQFMNQVCMQMNYLQYSLMTELRGFY